MSVQCDICRKTFKNAAGLAGHKQFVHGQGERKYIPKNEVLGILQRLEAKVESLGTEYPAPATDYPDSAELTTTVHQLAEAVKRLDGDTESKLKQVSERLGVLDKHTRNDLHHDIEEIKRRLGDMTVDQEEEGSWDWGTAVLVAFGGWVIGRIVEGMLEQERRKKALIQGTPDSSVAAPAAVISQGLGKKGAM